MSRKPVATPLDLVPLEQALEQRIEALVRLHTSVWAYRRANPTPGSAAELDMRREVLSCITGAGFVLDHVDDPLPKLARLFEADPRAPLFRLHGNE